MTDVPASLFFNIFLFLFIPFTFGYIFRKLKMSPIIGYMLGGIILSNFFGGLISKTATNDFAYFGILLLMFAVGLETRFDRMISLKKYVFYGGVLQLGLSALCVGLLSGFFGFNLLQSILIGIALSSSSTTIVAKIIQDKGEEGSFVGELAMGILIFQDLAFVPFMVVFTSLTGAHQTMPVILGKIAVDMFVAVLILVFAYYMGRRVVPVVFNRFARLSRELLNLLVVISIFLVAYLSTLLHISVFITIFVAGVVVSQTEEHQHIFTQIRPFRDLFAVIFFIFIGTNIDLGILFPILGPVLVFALLVMLVKAIIIFSIFLSFRFHSKLSTYLALFLFQIDEDAFILMSVAYKNGIFTTPQYMFVITVVLISLLITPALISKKEQVYRIFWRFVSRVLPFVHSFVSRRIDRDRSSIDALDIRDHVVICGYGRIGSAVGRALLLADIPFVAVDYNFQTVEKAKKLGITIVYGDPSDIDILDYVETEHASAIVVALPDRLVQETIILNAKKLNRDIIVMSRVHRMIDHKRMKDLGVHVVVQPEFEASMSIIKKIMLLKHIPKDTILRHIDYFKKEHEGI